MSNQELMLALLSELTQKNVQNRKVNQICNKLNIPFNGDILDLMAYVLSHNLIKEKVTSSFNYDKLKGAKTLRHPKVKKTSNDINL